jgi:hypothetical protein
MINEPLDEYQLIAGLPLRYKYIAFIENLYYELSHLI